MKLVRLTRPDGSAVAINAAEIVRVAPEPIGGTLEAMTRLTFRNGQHQDVTEAFDVVLTKLEEQR
jgi:hypothetical protein